MTNGPASQADVPPVNTLQVTATVRNVVILCGAMWGPPIIKKTLFPRLIFTTKAGRGRGPPPVLPSAGAEAAVAVAARSPSCPRQRHGPPSPCRPEVEPASPLLLHLSHRSPMVAPAASDPPPGSSVVSCAAARSARRSRRPTTRWRQPPVAVMAAPPKRRYSPIRVAGLAPVPPQPMLGTLEEEQEDAMLCLLMLSSDITGGMRSSPVPKQVHLSSVSLQ